MEWPEAQRGAVKWLDSQGIQGIAAGRPGLRRPHDCAGDPASLVPAPPARLVPARRRPSGLLRGGSSPEARTALERFVAEQYAAAHDARVTSFQPELIGVVDDSGRVLGAAGLHYGSDPSPFFLECYLGEPVERVLSRRLGRAVERTGLAEIGNVAARQPGDGCWLVGTIGAWLDGAGVEWAVFTATARLRALLARLGFALVELAVADPARVPGGAAEWGRYYESDPRVAAVSFRAHRDYAVRWVLGLDPLLTAAFEEGARATWGRAA